MITYLQGTHYLKSSLLGTRKHAGDSTTLDLCLLFTSGLFSLLLSSPNSHSFIPSMYLKNNSKISYQESLHVMHKKGFFWTFGLPHLNVRIISVLYALVISCPVVSRYTGELSHCPVTVSMSSSDAFLCSGPLFLAPKQIFN